MERQLTSGKQHFKLDICSRGLLAWLDVPIQCFQGNEEFIGRKNSGSSVAD